MLGVGDVGPIWLALLVLAGCGGTASRPGNSTGAEGESGDAGSCAEDEVGLGHLRRLTAAQYRNTVRDLLGVSGGAAEFSPDERVGPFESNITASVHDLQAEQYMAAGEAIAAQAVLDLGTLLPCDPERLGETECVRRFIEEIAPRAYRRPLLSNEVERLQQVFEVGRAEGDLADGVRLVIQALLQSPRFLYINELGTADGGDSSVVRLTDYELASRLSYFLWQTMPDDELFAAAGSGELATEAGLAAEVDRMLADPRAREGLASFHLQWLGVDAVGEVQKDPEVYPEFTADLAATMREETAAFASAVVLDADGTLATLLTADWTHSDNPELLALYGATLPEGHSAGAPVPLPPGQRAGLLTQASVLSVHAHANQTSPVHRGKLVRENLLCQLIPPPPPNVDDTPPSPDPNATTRERFEQHRADPACAACHDLIDGLGFGFEHYDGIGAWRERDGAGAVDARGWILGTDVDGAFDGVGELAAKLAASDVVGRCLSKQWFRFAHGRAETREDACTIEAVDAAFAESGRDVKVLIRALVLSDAFRSHRGEPIDADTDGGGS